MDSTTTKKQWIDIIDRVPWPMVLGGAQGVVEHANEAFARMHGYESAKAVLGLGRQHLTAPGSQRELASHLEVADRLGMHRFELLRQHKDGTLFPARLEVQTFKDPEGQLLFRVVRFEPLELSSQASGEMSKEVLEGLLEGCQIISPDYRYLFLNDVVTAQAGRAREELLGKKMAECFPGIDSTPMFALLQRSMVKRTHEAMENDFTHPDGRRIVYSLRFVPISQGVCILSLDITERRHELAAIVDSSEDAIFARRVDGVITNWNLGAERIFGYTHLEAVGRSVSTLLPERLKNDEARNTAQVLAGERIVGEPTVRLRKDGTEVEVSVTKSPIRNSLGQIIGISTIARDISQTNRLHRELVAAKQATEAANKELEAFSYTVAHDLRAPLRSIDGFSLALLEEHSASLNEEGRQYLQYVRESAELMNQLINDVLALSRLGRDAMLLEPVDLSDLARHICNRLQGQASKEYEIHVQEGLLVEGDLRMLSIAFNNLLGNAFKFSSKTERPRIEVGREVVDGQPTYFVKDNGAGFDMNYSKKLFGLFQRLHGSSEFEGTGVGLTTVQRVIHRHGGRIWGEGRVGAGATFWFTLPKPGGAHDA